MKKKYLMTLAACAALAMAGQHSVMGAEVGEAAPDFTLTGHDGNEYTLSDLEGQVVILEWLNHGCPFVVKHYETNNMQQLQERFTNDGVVWFSIISSAPGTQGYMTAEEAAATYDDMGVAATAILFDPEGTVGKAYGATRTPEMFIIGEDGVVLYHGAIDSDSGRTFNPEADNYVVTAMEEIAAGDEVSTSLTRPYGCTIKYAD